MTGTQLAVIDTDTKRELDRISGKEEQSSLITAIPKIERWSRIEPRAMHKFVGKYVVPLPADHPSYIPDAPYLAADEVSLIVLAKYIQYVRYDDKANKFYSTTLETSFQGEFLDNLGTTKLGKITGKAAQELNEKQAEENQKKGRAVMHVFCIASAKGSTVEADDVEVVNVPARLQFGGSNIIEIMREYFHNKKVFGRNDSYFECETILPRDDSPKLVTVGSNSFYPIDKLKRGKSVPVTQTVIDSIYAVQDGVNAYNSMVLAQRKKFLDGDYDDAEIAHDYVDDDQ